MQEKELDIDLSVHVCYSQKEKEVLQDYLSKRRSPDEAQRLWEKVQQQYVSFLKDQPYLGGKKCTHNGVGGTYDCIATMALYEALDKKPTVDELYEINNAVFLPPFLRLGKLVKINSAGKLKLLAAAFQSAAKRDEKLSETVTSGYLNIMPAFCNGDHPAMEAIGAVLTRKHTCANSYICDYLIMAGNDPGAAKYPKLTDENSYIYNESPAERVVNMPRYFMFNKPKGCVTARTDSLSKTVMDYFPEECRQTMYPVGRLDKDTEGLLLITDDGMLCRKLLLPKSHVPKTYFFYAIGELTEEKVSAISEGVEMKGRELPALPASIRCTGTGVITDIAEYLSDDKRERLLKYPRQKIFSGYITITEGKKHQVKRMMRSIGCCIVYLKRTAMGSVPLDESLAPGCWRPLTEEELTALKNDISVKMQQ